MFDSFWSAVAQAGPSLLLGCFAFGFVIGGAGAAIMAMLGNRLMFGRRFVFGVTAVAGLSIAAIVLAFAGNDESTSQPIAVEASAVEGNKADRKDRHDKRKKEKEEEHQSKIDYRNSPEHQAEIEHKKEERAKRWGILLHYLAFGGMALTPLGVTSWPFTIAQCLCRWAASVGYAAMIAAAGCVVLVVLFYLVIAYLLWLATGVVARKYLLWRYRGAHDCEPPGGFIPWEKPPLFTLRRWVYIAKWAAWKFDCLLMDLFGGPIRKQWILRFRSGHELEQ